MQKEMAMFLKRDYLKTDTPQIEEEYSCLICSDIITDPIKCLGACKRSYCRKCATLWIGTHNNCPMKCSDPWRIQQTPPIKLQFVCPFNSDCKIESPEQFVKHIEVCLFMDQERKQQCDRKNKYLCRYGHPLQFYTSTYDKMSDNTCIICSQKQLSRSYCPKCDEYYCVKCRIPRATKKYCPNGHPFSKLSMLQISGYICDICGMKPVWINKGISDDPICNFGVCDLCLQNLPQIQQIPINSNNYCKNNHLLSKLPKAQMAECSNCQKTRYCYKKCDNCKLQYCLTCKSFQIFRQECELKHQFQKINSQNSKICHFCQQTQSSTKYVDNHCGIQVCKSCFDQENQKHSNKIRLKQTHICDNNHMLQIFIGVQKIFRTCQACKQEKYLQYFCNKCPYTKFYCYQCKYFPLKDGCLWKDQMKPLEIGEGQTDHCMFCQKQTNQILFCKHCRLKVCKDCKQNSN